MRSTPLLLFILMVASCDKRSATDETTDPSPLRLPQRNGAASSPMSNLKPLPAQPESVLINAGTLPLAHLCEQGGPVRIVNATTKRTLLSTSVDAGSIISVSESGILIARQRRLTTSLDPKHRYEIWWDMGGRR
jgi:hypothetical protein